MSTLRDRMLPLVEKVLLPDPSVRDLEREDGSEIVRYAQSEVERASAALAKALTTWIEDARDGLPEDRDTDLAGVESTRAKLIGELNELGKDLERLASRIEDLEADL